MSPSEPAHLSRPGRYALALTLAAVAAVAGALGGWFCSTPKYTSTGVIRIKTNPRYLVYPPDRDSPLQISSFAKSQTKLLQDPRVLDRAMNTSEWKVLHRAISPESKDAFRDSLRVETRPDEPEWIDVKFTDSDPHAAATAVAAVIQSYIYIHGDKELVVTPMLVGELTTKIKTKQAEAATIQVQVSKIGQPFGTTDLESIHQEGLRRRVDLDRECAQLESDIKCAEETGKVLRFAADSAGQPRLVPVIADDIAAMKAALTLKKGQSEEQQRANLSMSDARSRIAGLNATLKKIEDQSTEIEHRYNMLVTESNNTDSANRIQIVSEGDEPTRPSSDYRLHLAALGFIAAGGLTFAASMLWSKGSLPQT